MPDAEVPTDYDYWRKAWEARNKHVLSLQKTLGTQQVVDTDELEATITRSIFDNEWARPSSGSSDQFRRRFEVSTEWLQFYLKFMQGEDNLAWGDLLHADPIKASMRADAAASTLRNVLWLLYREMDAEFQLRVDSSKLAQQPSCPIEVHVPHVSLAYTEVKTGSVAGNTGYQILASNLSKELRHFLVLGFHDHGKDELEWIKKIDPADWPTLPILNNSYVPFPAYRVFYEDERAKIAALYLNKDNDVKLFAVNRHTGQELINEWINAESRQAKMPQINANGKDAFEQFVNVAAVPFLEFRRSIFNREKGTEFGKCRNKPSLALLVAFAVPAEPIEKGGVPIDALYAFMSIELHCSADLCEKLLKRSLTKILCERLSYIQEPLLRQLAWERFADKEQRAGELSQHKAVLDSILPKVQQINETLARMQQDVQYVNSHISAPNDGLFRAYSQVGPLFQSAKPFEADGWPISHPFRTSHNCNYENGTYAACALVKAILSFLGSDVKDFFSKAVGEIGSDNLETESASTILLTHCDDVLNKVTKAQKRMVRSILAAIAISKEREEFWYGGTGALILTSKPQQEHLEGRLRALKTRYFELLKWNRPKGVQVHQLLPYIAIHQSGLKLNQQLWRGDSHEFANTEPIITLLATVCESNINTLSDHKLLHYRIRQLGEETFVFDLYSRSEIIPLHTDLLSSSKTKFDLAQLCETLETERKALSNSPKENPNYNYGYILGDVVTPLLMMLRRVPMGVIADHRITITHISSFLDGKTYLPLTAIVFNKTGWGVGYLGQNSIIIGNIVSPQGEN